MYVVYKTSVRRPVCLGPRLGLLDMQGVTPRGWCPVCGSEVFLLGTELCSRCKKEEEKNVCKKLRQSL